MAVIREQRQFGLSPVRVVRAETGGQAVGQALAQAGETFSDIMFRRAAVQAEKAGKEAALSVESQNVVAFDPVTQKPVALTPPKGLGTIATEAYQNVINQRFNQEIESDIKNRGTELALQFRDSANGSELYNQAMQDYVDQLKENAGGMYGEYISNVGGEYRESTYLKLKQDEQDRARAEAKRLRQLQHANNISNYIAIFSQFGIDADAQTPASTSDDMARSGQGSYTESAREKAELRQARAAGIVLFSINRTGDTNPNDAQNDLRALAMGPAGLSHIKDPMLKETMAEFANDASAWRNIAGEISQEAQSSIQRNILQDTVDAYGLDAVSSLSDRQLASEITTGDFTSIGSQVESLVAEKRVVAIELNKALQAGYSTAVAQINSGANGYSRRVDSVAGALTGNLIRAATTVDEINLASRALQMGSPDGLTGDLHDAVSQILNLSNGIGDEGIIDTAVSKLSNISNETAFLAALATEQANRNLSVLNNELATRLAVAATPEDVDGIRDEFNEAASAGGATNALAEGDLFDNFVARAHIRFAVDEAVTDRQLTAIKTYLRFQTDDNNLLTDSMRANLDAANGYGAKDPSRFNESLNTYIGGKEEQFRLEAQAAEQERIFNSILGGWADPRDVETMIAVERLFGAELTSENLPVFKNVLPQTLYNQFSKFGDGTLQPMVELKLLSQWDIISNTLSPDGTPLKTNAYLSIPAEQRAKLDDALTAISVYGEDLSQEELANMISTFNRAVADMSSPEGVEIVKSYLGGKTMEQFVLAQIPMAAFSDDVKRYAQTRMTMALHRAFTSNFTVDSGKMIEEIKASINELYTADPYIIGEGLPFHLEPAGEPNSGLLSNLFNLGIKRALGGGQNVGVTQFPLERTTNGHIQEFINYAAVFAGTTDIKFKAIGLAEDGGVLYQVYKLVGSQYLPVSHEVLDEQAGESSSIPLIISTSDPMFRNGIAKRLRAEQAIAEEKELTKAQAILTTQNEDNSLAAIVSESADYLETQLSSVSGIQPGTVREFLAGDVKAMERIYSTLSLYTGDSKTPEVIQILSAIEEIRSQIGNQ